MMEISMVHKDPVDKRRVLIFNGDNNEILLVVTDAPRRYIEMVCKKYLVDGTDILSELERHYEVFTLFCSEFHTGQDNVNAIGWDEEYDLRDYMETSEIEESIENHDNIELIGFVFCHGKDDYEVWTVGLPETVQNQIMDILADFDTWGCSIRDSVRGLCEEFSREEK